MNTNETLRAYCENVRDELQAIANGSKHNDDGEPVTMWDYFEDALDVEYTMNSRGEYLGARVYVALGGPNIWVDTREREIGGAWGTARESVYLDEATSNEIDSVFEEYFDALR